MLSDQNNPLTWRSGAALAAVSACLLLTACDWFPSKGEKSAAATKVTTSASGVTTNAKGQPVYLVQADFTPLYRLGPQQPNGPDQSLPKGTLVGLLKKSSGYSRVQLDSGLDGYVSTDDIAPAPPEAVAAVVGNDPTNTMNNSAIVEHYTVDGARKSAATSASNAEALPDLPQQSLEPDPTPIVKPDFRY